MEFKGHGALKNSTWPKKYVLVAVDVIIHSFSSMLRPCYRYYSLILLLTNYLAECPLKTITKWYHAMFSGYGGVDVESWE